MSLKAAFEGQAEACENLGSPFMGRLCRLFAARLGPGTAIADRLLAWPGDVSAAGQSVPLRVAGALHALVLEKADDDLKAAYPPNAVDDDALWSAIIAAFDRHEARLMTWLDSPPQTNEVRRAAAMITAAAILRPRTGLPLAVSELGASAGLNLMFDCFAMEAGGQRYGDPASAVVLRPNWTGPLPPKAPIEIIDRAGVDLRPIDATNADGALRLLAYLWPDQPDRLALTRAAISLATAPPDEGDAADWLASRLATPITGAVHLVYHTIAWQYFPPETDAKATAILREAGARARPPPRLRGWRWRPMARQAALR